MNNIDLLFLGGKKFEVSIVIRTPPSIMTHCGTNIMYRRQIGNRKHEPHSNYQPATSNQQPSFSLIDIPCTQHARMLT